MYTREYLEQYPYFRETIEKEGMQGIFDQLTGVISRGHILWFTQWLMAHQIPFSFAMMDLDNFKFVNDTYGHHIGDGVLVRVAQDLAAILDGIGLVGRFGGDTMRRKLFLHRYTAGKSCGGMFRWRTAVRSLPLQSDARSTRQTRRISTRCSN